MSVPISRLVQSILDFNNILILSIPTILLKFKQNKSRGGGCLKSSLVIEYEQVNYEASLYRPDYCAS